MAAAENIGYGNIQVKSPYSLLRIDDLQIIQRVNQHGKLLCTGLIDSGKADKVVEKATADDTVEVVVMPEDGSSQTLFKGLVQEIAVKTVRGNYFVSITALSYSSVLDVELKSRSFQNPQMTYDQLIKKVLEKVKGADCNIQVTGNTAIGGMIVQYQETDWQFLKRVASRLGAVLIPDSTRSDGPKFWMGLPERKQRSQTDFHYTVSKSLADYMITTANYAPDLYEVDFTGYEVESGMLFNIGDVVGFQNKTLRVTSVTAAMDKGRLRFTYILALPTAVRQNPIFNEQLSGGAIGGKVIDRQQDQVKVQMDIDSDQPKEEAAWLPYSSFYTAEGNSGWYCLPEIGDKVLVHFGDAYEENFTVMGSLRQDVDKNSKTSDPNTKYFGNSHGKELMMAGSAINLTAAGKNCELALKLTDDGGITIESDKELNFEAAQDLVIKSSKKLTLKAADGVYLGCRNSSIVMDGNTDIQGLKLILQATGPKVVEKVETSQPEKKESLFSPLDILQTGLSLLGFIPGWGAVFDVLTPVSMPPGATMQTQPCRLRRQYPALETQRQL